MARISLSELRTRASTVDRAKVDVTTEAEILAQRTSDPDAPAEMPADAHPVTPPKALRVRLGMTQPEMAAALGIPVGTWRNWEQGRVRLDPTASALLRIVSHNPGMALSALAHPDIKPSSRLAETEKRIAEVMQRLAQEVEARNNALHGAKASPGEVIAALTRLTKALGLEDGQEKLTA
jgi:putative transcriptional regulator